MAELPQADWVTTCMQHRRPLVAQVDWQLRPGDWDGAYGRSAACVQCCLESYDPAHYVSVALADLGEVMAAGCDWYLTRFWTSVTSLEEIGDWLRAHGHDVPETPHR